jgi:hypothetical protein
MGEIMSEFNFNINDVQLIKKRINKEFSNMKLKEDEYFINNNEVNIYFTNELKEDLLFTWKLSRYYPFRAPEFIINGKPYTYYTRFYSYEFELEFYKKKGNKCFCCDTLLKRWAPNILLHDLIKEYNNMRTECREIFDNIIVNIIKRKYLIDNINIMEWLY